MLRAAWQYRGLIGSLVRRELGLRSQRALWGHAWLVIQPAMQIVIYTVIFAGVLRARLPGVDDSFAYGFYVCAGIITWGYFADIVNRSCVLFLDHGYLLKAVPFPRSALPAALLLSATLNFAILAGLFAAVLAVSGRWPGWIALAWLPLLAVQVVLALGLGVLCGTLNAFYRDVGNAMGVLLQFWFWLTPIVYPIGILPDALRGALAWNPLVPLVSGYQRVAIQGAPPDWEACAGTALFASFAALCGWAVFRALSVDLVDEL